jgi:hypothetical protein
MRCESCGAPWEMRGFANTKTIACESCGTIFDTSGESWQLVQEVEGAYVTKPRYPLGTRGKLDDVEWEIIGWVKRSVRSCGIRYTWEEHLLFNPYEGFRYLMYQDGHFVVMTPIPGAPTAGLKRARYRDRSYRHFSTAKATVDEVLGEFPWEVRRGDAVKAADYVDPPRILSSEKSEGELVWSEGRYLTRDEVVAAFGEPARAARTPDEPHPCQPNPTAGLAKWMLKAVVAGVIMWALLTLIYSGSRQDREVWRGTLAGNSLDATFTLDSGRDVSTVEVDAWAGVNNSWVYVECLLVETASEKASYIGLDVSYYHGSSGGESWSEGSKSTSELVSGIPNGEYLLQVSRHKGSRYKGPVNIKVSRDVVLYRYPCCSLLLLLIVPMFVMARNRAFEQKRWQQSDYGT